MEFLAITLLQAVFGGQLISIPSVGISACFWLNVCYLFCAAQHGCSVRFPSNLHVVTSWHGGMDTSKSAKPQYSECSILTETQQSTAKAKEPEEP